MINQSELNLGDLVRVYKTTIGSYWMLLLISGCMACIGLILLFAVDRNGRLYTSDAEILLLVFGTLTAIPLLVIAYQIKNEVRFYKNGIVYENRRSIRTAYWNEIADVWEWCVVVRAGGIPSPRQMFYAVRTTDGNTIRFPRTLNDIAELGSRLKTEASKRNIPIRNGVPPMKYALKNLFSR